jgi:hypothetical protein
MPIIEAISKKNDSIESSGLRNARNGAVPAALFFLHHTGLFHYIKYRE